MPLLRPGSPQRLTLTDEQQAVVATDTPVLQVHAFAGTGKTATLAALAEARPRQRFLYVAFNKAVQLEATRRFPPNVVAKTCHALAFQAVGRRYQHKLVSALRVPEVLALLDLDSAPLADAYPLAQAVLDTLQQFLTSADSELDRRHVPALYRELYGSRPVKKARRLWRRMCDPHHPLGMVHDGYLKLYQLSQPTLAGVDAILFDESHDADSAMLDIVRRQPLAQVYVGDRHQKIYGWRGSCNALEAVNPSAVRYLARSFRFGARIAALANLLLSHYKGETVPVQGCRGEGAISDINPARPYTLIARTNAGVFAAAAEQVCRRRPPRLGFVGGVNSYPFERILDAWRLASGERSEVRDPWLRTFPDFATLERLAYDLDEAELKQLCRVVHQYGPQIPALVRQIRQRAVAELTEADVCLTTAHKAKGLEFAQVRLAEDFPSLLHTPPAELNLEEVNLLYVAITRTVEVLEINTPVQELIEAWSQAAEVEPAGGQALREQTSSQPFARTFVNTVEFWLFRSLDPAFNLSFQAGQMHLFILPAPAEKYATAAAKELLERKDYALFLRCMHRLVSAMIWRARRKKCWRLDGWSVNSAFVSSIALFLAATVKVVRTAVVAVVLSDVETCRARCE